MGKGKAESAMQGFGKLMQLASCTTEFLSCRYSHFEHHPFGFKIPKAKPESHIPLHRALDCKVVYVGMSGDKSSVKSFYRVVGREIANRFEKDFPPLPVHFLRKTNVYGFGDNDEYHWTWYEVGVGKYLFIVGHIINKGGYGERDAMENLMTCLSTLYSLPINHGTVSCAEWERRQFGIERVFEQNAATFKECAILHDYY